MLFQIGNNRLENSIKGMIFVFSTKHYIEAKVSSPREGQQLDVFNEDQQQGQL
jgi:hypothetical protein